MLDFLIIGGTKCGSTSLADYVSASQKVNFCREKEPAVLNRHSLSTHDIDLYQSLFPDQPGLKGEATTAYSDYGQVKRVIANLKLLEIQPKLILSVRNQVKRIESGYVQGLKVGKIKPGQFQEIPLLTKPGILNRGMFGHVLRTYLETFPRNNILVLNFDLLIQPDSPELVKLKAFLDLEEELPLTLPRSNPSIGGGKKHWIAIFYKRYLARYWREHRLPSLTVLRPLVDRLSTPVQSSEVLRLSEEQVAFLRDHYRADEALFKELTGWSYWDIHK